MKPEEITSLAREYAEEIRADILPFFPRPLPESMEVLVRADQEKADRFLRFLLRRFCLVEKEAVRKEYQDSYKNYKTAGNARPLSQQHFRGRCFALESLFPEIVKEVEG